MKGDAGDTPSHKMPASPASQKLFFFQDSWVVFFFGWQPLFQYHLNSLYHRTRSYTPSFDTMLASRRFLACVFLFQIALLSLASPTLSGRDNHLHLKCTNAPTVVAG